MANAIARVTADAQPPKLARAINDIVDAILGLNGKSLPVVTGVYLLLTGGTLTGDLLFSADNTHDVGASGATRPRDLFLARNAVIGGTLGVTGVISHNGEAVQKPPEIATCTPNTPLTNAMVDVPNASLSLSPGNWTVRGYFQWFEAGAGDVGQTALGQLVTSGGTASIVNSTSQASANLAVLNASYAASMEWVVQVTATTLVKLQNQRVAGTGTSFVAAANTVIVATYGGN